MKQYICIDLKSFYASVECVERGLDPEKCDLVVADPERTDKTICLAVTPSLKAKGVKNRCRLFEIPKNLKYVIAPPRMQKYIDYSAEIYSIYLKYFSCEDIHVYSIDEVFIDATDYLKLYKLTARALAEKVRNEIYSKFKIRATCGIGTNLYLAKIALDISAKKSSDHIGVLDEKSFCETLWYHRPLTDFWRIGKGCASRLEKHGIYTMHDITVADEDMLYKVFGIDAELLIDHAWGKEPTTIKDIKNYQPKTSCISQGQVLMRDYSFEEGITIVKEMADTMSLELISKNVIASSLTLHIGYSNSLSSAPAHSTASFSMPTNSPVFITKEAEALYKKIINPDYTIKRIYIICNNVIPSSCASQLSFLNSENDEKSQKLQHTILSIKSHFGKNSILRGINFSDCATTIERNQQIGGHKSG